MKYEEADYVNDGGVKRIKVSDYTSQQLEEMKMVGKFQCPGKNCDAELCLVHSSKNGGSTYFLQEIIKPFLLENQKMVILQRSK